jgi:hypothetical protein
MNLRYAALIALGLFIGAYFGARLMIPLPVTVIRRLYAAFLFLIAARMMIMGK